MSDRSRYRERFLRVKEKKINVRRIYFWLARFSETNISEDLSAYVQYIVYGILVAV